MKVSDLIAKLESFPSEAEVLCYTEDENLLAKGHMFRLLEIEDVSLDDVTKVRGPDNVPSFRLETSDTSELHALVSVTSDF